MKIKTLLKFSLPVLILLLSGLRLHGQHSVVADEMQPYNYLMLSAGITSNIYRDFATSPLFYYGTGINLCVAWQINQAKNSHLAEIDFSAGAFIDDPPRSDFLQSSNFASLFSFSAYYQYLHHMHRFSNQRFDVSLGGAFAATQNIRVNPGLMNAGAGLETFANLMATGRVSMDLSRTLPKTIDILPFIDLILHPVQKDLSFQLGAGLLNFNRRPGYAFVYISEVDGINTDPITWVNVPYEWSMNGWRFSARLEASRYWPSGNGRTVAYIWDVLHAPGRFEAFQMASHRLQYIIMINNSRPLPVTLNFN